MLWCVWRLVRHHTSCRYIFWLLVFRQDVQNKDATFGKFNATDLYWLLIRGDMTHPKKSCPQSMNFRIRSKIYEHKTIKLWQFVVKEIQPMPKNVAGKQCMYHIQGGAGMVSPSPKCDIEFGQATNAVRFAMCNYVHRLFAKYILLLVIKIAPPWLQTPRPKKNSNTCKVLTYSS